MSEEAKIAEAANVNLTRSLLLILALHVVAIVGIFAHHKMVKNDEIKGDGKDEMSMFLKALKDNPEITKDPELIKAIAMRMDLKEDSVVLYKGKELVFGGFLEGFLAGMSAPSSEELKTIESEKGGKESPLSK